MWNIKTRTKLYQVDHTDSVHCVKIVDELLVSCGDTTIRIWKLKNGNYLHELQLPDWCRNFDLNWKNTLLAVAHDLGVSIWDFSRLRSFDGKDFSVQISIMEITTLEKVMDVRFSESGTRLIVGQHDGKVFKIDLY